MNIKTNDRFDRLCNLDISTHYMDKEYYLFKSSLLSAFAYCVVNQSPYDTPDINDSLKAFDKYISEYFIGDVMPVKITYHRLREIIDEDAFEDIPEIEKLNHAKIEQPGFIASSSRYHTTKPDYDYIDLGALARNVFYMVLRIYICDGGF